MRLVDDWRKAGSWLSVQVLAAIAVLPIVWAELPPDVKAMVPADWRQWIVTGLAVAGIVARLKKQGPRDD